MSKLRSSLTGKQSLDEAPLINPVSGTAADEDKEENEKKETTPAIDTAADEDKEENEKKETTPAIDTMEKKNSPINEEKEIKSDFQDPLLGDTEIERKIRETFKSHEKLSEKEFMTLFQEIQTPQRFDTIDINAQSINTVDLPGKNNQVVDPFLEEDKAFYELQIQKMHSWKLMPDEEKLEINSRLYAIPNTNDVGDDKFHHHLTDEEWKKKLVKILGPADSDELDLIALTERYANKKYFDDHFSYDMVIVLAVGSDDPEQCVVIIERDEANEDCDSVSKSTTTIAQKEHFGNESAKIIGSLKRAGLETHLYYSGQEDEIYCLVGASERRLRRETARTRMGLLLEPTKVLHYGLKSGYKLAKRIDNKRKKEESNRQSVSSQNRQKKIDDDVFKNLYGHYKSGNRTDLYTHYAKKNELRTTLRHPATIFTSINRLKLTRTIIEAEVILGGAHITFHSDIKSKNSPVLAFYPLHDNVLTKELQSKMLKICSLKREKQPVLGLREYFGEQIGMYFHFLYKYVLWLIIPACVGLGCSIWQLGASDFGVAGSPIFGFLMCIWSTGFLEQWKREQAVLRMKWGMTRFRETETDRPEFEGEFTASAITGEYEESVSYLEKLGKMFCSHMIVFVYISVVAITVFLLFILRAIMKQLTDVPFVQTVLPPVLNALVIMIFNVIWGKFAVKLNDFENHKKDTAYEDSLVLKSFLFKFVNSYFSLFYIVMVKRSDHYTGYCKRSYVQLTRLIKPGYWFDMATPTPRPSSDWLTKVYVFPPTWLQKDWNNWICAAGAVSPIDSNQTVPNGDASVICNAWNHMEIQSEGWEYRGNCLEELGFQLVIIFATQMIVNNLLEIGKPILANYMEHEKQSKGVLEGKKSIAEKEYEFVAYEGTFDDFDELVVQFGYITLFVGAFPLVPMLALINNWLENWIDGSKLLKLTRRPHPKATYSIGTWEMILNVVSYIAILTNVSLAILNRNLLFEMGSISSSLPDRLTVFLILEHCLGISKVFVAYVVDDTPVICIEHMGRQEKVVNLLIGG